LDQPYPVATLHWDTLRAFQSNSNQEWFSDLFPRLRTLKIGRNVHDTVLPLVSLFIESAPRLKTFEITLGRLARPNQQWVSFLTRLRLSHGRLADIYFNLPPRATFTELVNDFVAQRNGLQKLATGSTILSRETLASIAAHDALTDLQTKIPDLSHLDDIHPLLPKTYPSFPALEHLEIQTLELKASTSFILLASSQSLTSCSTSFTLVPTAADVRNHISALQKGSNPGKLQKISMTTVSLSRALESWTLESLDIRTFRSLFTFRNLQQVEMEVPFSLACVDNTLLKELAEAWPGLKSLQLDGNWPVPRKVTLEGLLPFARWCPKLEMLQLTLDSTVLPDFREGRDRPGGGFCNTNLTLLVVGDSELEEENVKDVAAFLSDFFPSLIEILSHGEGVEDWENVAELIPAFAGVRQQERNWAARHSSTA
jgi:hypothetical protein